jgi:hypothetical protein
VLLLIIGSYSIIQSHIGMMAIVLIWC